MATVTSPDFFTLPQLAMPAPWHSAAFKPWTKYLQRQQDATGLHGNTSKPESWSEANVAYISYITYDVLCILVILLGKLTVWACCISTQSPVRGLSGAIYSWKHCEHLSNVGSPLGIWTLWPIFGSSGCYRPLFTKLSSLKQLSATDRFHSSASPAGSPSGTCVSRASMSATKISSPSGPS